MPQELALLQIYINIFVSCNKINICFELFPLAWLAIALKKCNVDPNHIFKLHNNTPPYVMFLYNNFRIGIHP